MHGAPHDETVIVTHHSLVVPDGCAKQAPPLLAGRLEETRDLLLAGQSAAALELFGAGWPEHAMQPFHPAFAIRLRLGGHGPVSGYRRAVDFAAGVVAAQWADGAGAWRRTCFVSRARDVVVQRLEVPPGAGLHLVVDHDVTLPGAPPGLRIGWQGEAVPGGALLGVHVDYPDPPTGPGRPAVPGGPDRGYAGATRIVAAGGRCVTDGRTVRIVGARDVLLLTRVARHGAGPESGTCAAEPMPDLAGLPADHERLLAEHTAAHRAAYGRVGLDLGADPADRELPVAELLARQAAHPDIPLPALLEKLFDSGRYLLLASSGLLPPRLTGLWQGDWAPAWSGCISANANLNLQLAGAVTADVPAAVSALADLVEGQLDDWRVNARRLYGTRGILAPAQADGSDGLCRHFAGAYPHHMWTAGADWLLVPLLDYVDATGDLEFLRRRVLPALTELALFYEDFLGRRDDHGHAVFAPSYSPENQPGGWSAAAVNATMDIAAARHALTAACDAAGRLPGPGDAGPGDAGPGDAGPGDAGPERWRALLGRLPPYRVNADGALAEWAWPAAGPPLPDRYDHRHVSHLYPVWPLHEITVDDTPKLAAAAWRALRLRGTENGSAHGYLHQALAAARLRDADLAGGRLAALTGRGFFFRSLMSSHYPGGEVYNADAACALPGLLIEMLADSVPPRADRPGRVELLPAVPAFLRAGCLRGARTLTRVRLDLTWDLTPGGAAGAVAGTVEAVLRSPVSQQIDLTWRAGAASLPAGPPGPSARSPGIPAAVSCQAPPVTAVRLHGGCWRLDLAAGRPARVRLEAAP